MHKIIYTWIAVALTSILYGCNNKNAEAENVYEYILIDATGSTKLENEDLKFLDSLIFNPENIENRMVYLLPALKRFTLEPPIKLSKYGLPSGSLYIDSNKLVVKIIPYGSDNKPILKEIDYKINNNDYSFVSNIFEEILKDIKLKLQSGSDSTKLFNIIVYSDLINEDTLGIYCVLDTSFDKNKNLIKLFEEINNKAKSKNSKIKIFLIEDITVSRSKKEYERKLKDCYETFLNSLNGKKNIIVYIRNRRYFLENMRKNK